MKGNSGRYSYSRHLWWLSESLNESTVTTIIIIIITIIIIINHSNGNRNTSPSSNIPFSSSPFA